MLYNVRLSFLANLEFVPHMGPRGQQRIANDYFYEAVLVELVDTPDLGSGGETCPGSSPGDGTISNWQS